MIVVASENKKRSSILNNLDKSIFVEAGAGAGKTTLIVNRNIQQIKAGELKASELVDITFTKAAAEELRSRLLENLHNAAEDSTCTLEEKARIEAAIKDESQIQISTIHSFCKRLLTEQTFAAKLPLDVRLLDDKEADARKNKFFNEWYGRQNTVDLEDIQQQLTEGDVGEFIHNSFMEICELPNDVNIIYDKSLIGPTAKRKEDYIDDMRKQLSDYSNVITPIIIATTPKQFNSFEDIKDAVKAGFTKAYDGMNTPLIKDFIDLYKSGINEINKGTPFKSSKSVGIKKDDISTMEGKLKRKLTAGKTFDNLLDKLEAYQSALIVNMAEKARKEYKDYCLQPENRHEITNDALLQETLDLVKNNAEARAYFQSKFSCIYVDEFQDTDLVQRELIEILCQDPLKPNKIRKGVLFFVGDPKQSIYAFRGADVDVYEDTKKKYEADSIVDVEEYVLDDNYRSEKTIVDWVNVNFAPYFNKILSGGYSNMNASKKNNAGKDIICGIYTLNSPKWSKGSEEIYTKAETAKDRESRMVTAIIKHLVEDGFQIWDNSKTRKIEYRDFMLLCPKKKDINIYADKLKKAGIPVNLYGSLDNENEDVIIRMSQLYKALTYRYDREAVHGALEVLMGSKIDNNNYIEAKARFELLIQKTEKKTGMELLQFLSHHLEYIMTSETVGSEASRMQSRLQQMLEYVQSNSLGDRQDVYGQIVGYMSADVDKELSMKSDENAVRLMNLHKAKGLEAKIVIICARSEKTNSASPYRTMKDYYPLATRGEGIYKKSLRTYACDDSINKKANDKTRDEKVRQDYVEVTRAEEALIFMDALTKKNNCYFNEYDFGKTENLVDLLPNLKKDIEEIKNDNYSINTSLNKNLIYDSSKWDFKKGAKQEYHQEHLVTPSSVENDDKGGWNPTWELGRPCGSVFGTAMHRCFELLVNKLRKPEKYDLDTIIRQALMENYTEITIETSDEKEAEKELDFYKTYLESKLKTFISDAGLVNDIANAKAVYTEMSFSQYADQSEVCTVNQELEKMLKTRFPLDDKEPYWINGQADLVIVDENDNVQIIDYKTDYKGNETVADLEAHLKKTYDN
ncbi:MAG: UvrD-helicase domain-containing protein, partial [Parasporobacterium sp.]|nr:UvrD-helicase domain-containing protein [Parasporobacterium sp.]